MKSEKIIKSWRLCYLYLFDEKGYETREKYVSYKDTDVVYHCSKIFWRFYWVFDNT